MEYAKTPRLAPHSDLYQMQRQSPPAEPNCWRHAQQCPTETEEYRVDMEEVSQMFEKKFHYQQQPGLSTWALPAPRQLFGEYYQLEPLQELKERLNHVKCKLNDYVLEDWSLHTRRQDPSNEISWLLKNETKAEFVTIAWCKFYECLHTFPLVKSAQLNSLHLCELPGAFITALNHYLHSRYDTSEVNWKWLSTTLNPYYEGNSSGSMISDDRFMFHTFDNWLMHDDFTGNIINCRNIEQMQRVCAMRLDNNVQLITADGSIDCVDAPDCQEEVVAALHFAEIVAALSILSDGGCFVLKMFTLFEATNVCKLFLLNCVFAQVYVFKPVTSKRGNSEVYVVCLGYKKHTKHLQETLKAMKSKVECDNVLPLFPKSHLPRDFLQQHEICARRFMNLQIQAIESNIRTYVIKPTRREVRYKQLLRTEIAKEFCRRFCVRSIPADKTILHGHFISFRESYKSAPPRKGSYSERATMKTMSLEEQIFSLHRKLNDLEKALNGRHGVLLATESDTPKGNIPPLHVYRGAHFPELRSSLFIDSHVLLMYHELKDVLGSEPLCQDEAYCTLDHSKISYEYSSASNYSCMQLKFYVSVIETIIAQRPTKVTFKNMAFLTHFAASLLRFLSVHVFERFSIEAEPTYEITLHQKQSAYNAAGLAKLIEMHDLLKSDNKVLCVVALQHLHRNEFHNALSEYNNLLLLKNFKLQLKN